MHTVHDVKELTFPQRGDERGHLVVVEGEGDIPFAIQRVFYIFGSDEDVVRGMHANRRSAFAFINVAGTSKVDVEDGTGETATYTLDRPHMGVYLPPMLWKRMYAFSRDSVLLVLASEHYDATEYIRSYDAYKKEYRL